MHPFKRFRLSTLLLFTTILGVALGIHTSWIRQAESRREKYLTLIRTPGVCDCLYSDELDEQLTTHPLDYRSWLEPLGIKRDYFNRLAVFKLEDHPNPAPLLSSAFEIGELRWVSLCSCNVDQETLDILSGIKSLERLDLSYSMLEKASLLHALSTMRLKILDLRGTHLTRGSVNAIANCDSLRYVYLQQSTVSQSEIQFLRKKLPDCVIFQGRDGLRWPALK